MFQTDQLEGCVQHRKNMAAALRAVKGCVSPICVTGLVRIMRRTTSATSRQAGHGRLNVNGGPAKRR